MLHFRFNPQKLISWPKFKIVQKSLWTIIISCMVPFAYISQEVNVLKSWIPIGHLLTVQLAFRGTGHVVLGVSEGLRLHEWPAGCFADHTQGDLQQFVLNATASRMLELNTIAKRKYTALRQHKILFICYPTFWFRISIC